MSVPATITAATLVCRDGCKDRQAIAPDEVLFLLLFLGVGVAQPKGLPTPVYLVQRRETLPGRTDSRPVPAAPGLLRANGGTANVLLKIGGRGLQLDPPRMNCSLRHDRGSIIVQVGE